MLRFLHIGLLTGCLLVNTQADSHTFNSDKLKKAAEMLGVVDVLDSLPLGQTSKVVAKDGMEVCIRLDGNLAVEHIGIPLFDNTMRELIPSPVYDFLEFAVLDWKYKVNPNTLNLSKVLFRKGSWETLTNGHLEGCECHIGNMEDKLYVVTWQRDSQDVAVVGIPIEYELLSNDSRRNLEREFIDQLSRYKPPVNGKTVGRVSESDLKIYGTEGLFVIQGESYIHSELNQNVYYTLKTVYQKVDTVMSNQLVTETYEDVVPAIVLNKEFPNESLANIVMCKDGEIPDPMIKLDFHLSDYRRRQIVLPLSQLKDFCILQGCKLFFAGRGVSNGSELVRGMFLVHNPAKGYNHLFSLSIPVEQIPNKESEIQAAAYLFIPSIDKSHLFGKTPTRKSGAKIKQHL